MAQWAAQMSCAVDLREYLKRVELKREEKKTDRTLIQI